MSDHLFSPCSPCRRESPFRFRGGARGGTAGATLPERGRKPGIRTPGGRLGSPGHEGGNYADESAKRKYPTWSVIAGYDDGFPETSPEGSFDPNPHGFFDLGANVFEWCEDFDDGKWGYRISAGARTGGVGIRIGSRGSVGLPNKPSLSERSWGRMNDPAAGNLACDARGVRSCATVMAAVLLCSPSNSADSLHPLHP